MHITLWLHLHCRHCCNRPIPARVPSPAAEVVAVSCPRLLSDFRFRKKRNPEVAQLSSRKC